jgi:hypothetical protein
VELNRKEARSILVQTKDELRRLPYAELVGLVRNKTSVVGPSGATYIVEVETFFDRPEEINVRVLISVDDGGWSAFVPMTDDFIIASDGSFVGE